VADLKRQIAGKVSAGGQIKVKHHIQSIVFGLGVGVVVVVITLFSFFNEYIIAPFIQPSRQASATPLIVGSGSVSPSATPEVIIPKINVEIPLNFSVGTTNEDQIESALEDGVVHYPTTVQPGQKGNTAFFGHSSNNIFNPGHYKFAFALLHDLVPGDTFYLTYRGKVYAYQVYQRQIVDPSEVSVLDNVPGKVATATLITCDPPGTSLHRLVVWGEQVSPNPNGNVAGSNTSADISTTTELPSNGPSLWDRFVHGLTGWL
jgi:LPXTG-site transpeptidase (sortase) family protein